MSDYQVQIEFKAVLDDLKSGLDKITQQLSGVADKSQGAGAGMSAAGAEGAAGMGAAGAATGGLTMALVKAEAIIGAVKEGFALLTEGIKAFMHTGIEFDQTMENARLGIGTLIASQTTMKDAQGNLLQGQEKLNAGLDEGAAAMNRLRIGSFSTTATFQQLVQAYQMGLGPMLAAGLTLKDSTDMTIKFAQAAGALGLDMGLLGHELRATFSGQVSARITRIATALLHLKPGDINAWKAQGTVVEELNKRLEIVALTGPLVEQTWTGVLSNVKHAFESFTGEGVQPFFEAVKTGLHDALSSAFDLSKGGFSDRFTGLLTTARSFFAVFGDLAKGAIKWFVDGLATISAYLDAHRVDVEVLLENFKQLALQVGGLVKDFFRMLGIAGDTGDAINSISLGLKVAAGMMAMLRDAFSVVVGALAGFAALWAAQFLYPVQQGLRYFGELRNLMTPGSGDKFITWADNVAGVYQKLGQVAKETAGDVLQGNGALAEWMANADDILEKKEAAKGRKGKKAASITPNTDAEDQADANVQAKIALELQKDSLAALERKTIAEKEAYEVEEAIQLSMQRRAEIQKALDAGNITEAQAAEDRAKVVENRDEKIEAIHEKYEGQRRDAAAKLNADLTGQEDVGLAQRLDKVKEHFRKLREEAEIAGTLEVNRARLDAAEALAIQHETDAATEAGAQKLRRELAELAKEKGRALSFEEQMAALDQLAAKLGVSAEAVARLRAEMVQSQNGWAGFKAGLMDIATKAQDTFTNVKNAVTRAFQGMQQSLETSMLAIETGQAKGGDALKALWKGITTSILQAINQLIAGWLIGKLAGLFFHDDLTKAAQDHAVAEQESAAATLWATYAAIPFAGPALATAFIALMGSELVANAGAAKGIVGHASGGIISSPTLALLGEGREPEVVVPKSSFQQIAYELMTMGGALQRRVQRDHQSAANYNGLARSYGGGAAVPGEGMKVERHVHFHAPVIGASYADKLALADLQAEAQVTGLHSRAWRHNVDATVGTNS